MDEQKKLILLLRKNLEISEESLKLVKRLHKAMVWNRTLFFLKWFIIIAVALGAYYYIQPYVGSFIDTYDRFKEDVTNLRESAGNLNIFKN